MFKALLNWRRRKELERAFKKLTGMLPTGVEPEFDPVEREVDVAFISFPAIHAREYSERTALVLDLADQHEGSIHSILPIVIVTLGYFGPKPSGARLRFIKDVQARLPAVTSIVHGTVVASVGPFGGGRYQVFGFWWPGAYAAMRQLTTLAPGESAELHVEPTA